MSLEVMNDLSLDVEMIKKPDAKMGANLFVFLVVGCLENFRFFPIPKRFDVVIGQLFELFKLFDLRIARGAIEFFASEFGNLKERKAFIKTHSQVEGIIGTFGKDFQLDFQNYVS